MNEMTKPKTKLQPKRRGGRPNKFKDTMLEEAQQLAGLGFTEEELAVYWSISPRTLIRWKKRNPELCHAIEKGSQNATISVTRAMYGQATRGNMTAIIFWLTNRKPELWRDRRAIVNLNQDIKTHGNMAVSNQVTDGDVRQVINKYTPEQKHRLLTAIKDIKKEFEQGQSNEQEAQ